MPESFAVQLAMRLALNLFCVFVLSRIVRRRSTEGFTLAQVMLNLVTFAIAWLMNRVPGDIGLGLGLFAIFGILRYRTEALRITDLTYLFVGIGLGLINGMQAEQIGWPEVLLLDGVMLAVPAIIEWRVRRTREYSLNVLYDRLDLLANPDGMRTDLKERLGLDCISVDVGSVDLLRESAKLQLRIRGKEGQ